MEKFTQDTFQKDKDMVKVFTNIQMEESTKEIGKMTQEMDLAHSKILMAPSMREIGSMTNDKAKASIFLQTELLEIVCGSMTKRLVKLKSRQKMAISTMQMQAQG